METGRAMIGVAAAAALAVGVLVAPALGATAAADHKAHPATTAARALGGFTPASADPRLAAVFARGGLDAGSFHFTPAESRSGNRAVTVAVRARSNATQVRNDRLALVSAPTASAVGIAPIAYNLGVAVGWKRFAVAGDMSRIDLGQLPGSREAADVSLSYHLRRFSGVVKATSDRPIGPLASGPTTLAERPSYSVDLGGAYALTRNLQVTAGVRYRADRDRLVRAEDDRRDSQAVYVGTAFHF